MPANRYETIFPGELCRVKEVMSEILEFIQEKLPAVTAEDIFDIRLIFMELMCNAVLHGNKQDIRKHISVSVEISQNAINTTIIDEGIGFDYTRLLSNLGANNETDHGRGIRLVHALTDSMSFNVTGNEIQFNKRVAPDEQSAGS